MTKFKQICGILAILALFFGCASSDKNKFSQILSESEKKMNKKALIVGATGVVGREILNELLRDESYDEITIWVRRDPGISHPKLQTKIINFDEISQIEPKYFDEIFCALGTTMKQAGSKEAFLKVDVEYVEQTAIWGKKNGAKRFLLVSAPNAGENSMFFYFRAKAMAQNAVIAQNYETTQIFAPPLIKGERKDKRTMEKIMINFYELFPKSWFDNYPMSGKEIAKQIVKATKMSEKGVKFYRLRAKDLEI